MTPLVRSIAGPAHVRQELRATEAGRGLRLLWQVTPPLVLLLIGVLLFPSGGHDDTHITCWPAYTLSRFGEILNYNGDRVEQSSSLLQVLLLAALEKTSSVDLLTLAKLSSIAGGVVSVLLVMALVSRAGSRFAGSCAALTAAASIPIVYWSFSGMESSLVAATGLWLVVTTADYVLGYRSGSLAKSTCALTAFALVRPETPLLLTAFMASTLAVVGSSGNRVKGMAPNRRVLVRRTLLLVLVSAIICGSVFAFRLVYFGALFPQPVNAKFAGLSVDNALMGLRYVKRHTWGESPATAMVALTIALCVLLTVARQLRATALNLHVVLSFLFVAGYFCCVVLSGGDWMSGGRFFAHFLPVAFAFVPWALDGVLSRSWILPAATVVLLTLEATAIIAFARSFSTSAPLWSALPDVEAGTGYSWFERRSRINVRDMRLIDRLDEVVTRVSTGKDGPVIVLSGQMGMVTYHIALRHFGRVRFVDRHGLIERSLTSCSSTRGAPRDTGGLVLNFARYFEHLAEPQENCQLARPDVVFDIGSFDRSRIAAHGYREVYAQSGEVTAQDTKFAGLTVRRDAFVAVDAALVALSNSSAARWSRPERQQEQ
jgi:hypothetical protein